MSSKLAYRATSAWGEAGLQRITLHECRHTYASLLMAAGYTHQQQRVPALGPANAPERGDRE